MKFIETTESAWSAEQLAAAEREIENQKREWEQNRLAAMKEEEERRNRELEEESEMLTFSREDATNQVSSKSKRLLGVRSQVSKSFKKRKKMIKTKLISPDVNKKEKKMLKRNNSPKKVTENIIEKVDKELNLINSQDSEESQMIDESSQVSEEIENSLDSNESEYNAKINLDKNVINKLDHNSPRTRSRGTVAINLWTLDVSPILPGEKPTRKLPKLENTDKDDDEITKSLKSSSSESDDDDKNEKSKCKQKIAFQKMLKDNLVDFSFNNKMCSVELCDILFNGEYIFPKIICYTKRDFDKSLEMIRKVDFDKGKSNADLSEEESKKESEKCCKIETEECSSKNCMKNDSAVEKTTSQNISEVVTSTFFNHVINNKEKTIQSKLLSESMLKEKYVREEIKKSLNVEANFDTKFHIPKKSSIDKSPSDGNDDKLQLSDISDGEFSTNDNSNSESRLLSKLPLTNDTDSSDNPNDKLFVTTSYQETFRSYIQSHHKILNSSNTVTTCSINTVSGKMTNSSNVPTNSSTALMNSSDAMTNSSNTLTNSLNVLITSSSLTTNSNALTGNSNESRDISKALTNSSTITSQSDGSSNAPRMSQKQLHQRRFVNNRFQDGSRKYGKFRNTNYTLDNWLNSSKANRNKKRSDSNSHRSDEQPHRDAKSNSFS